MVDATVLVVLVDGIVHVLMVVGKIELVVAGVVVVDGVVVV